MRDLHAHLAQIDRQYPLIGRVFDLTRDRGIPVYLVGGTVRDLLLERETHDLDFATDADGLEVARYIADKLRGAYVALDRERGVGRVLVQARRGTGPAFSGTDLYLDIASLRGPDLFADLRDRDFTINAMAITRTPAGNWRLLDPLAGYQDLQNRVLRSTSSSSFADDPVRLLRAVRIAIQFGCTIQPQTRADLVQAVPLLSRVSPERIRDEWFKMLGQSGAAQALAELHQLGLLHWIAPPMEKLHGLPMQGVHGRDLLLHSFDIVQQMEHIWAAFQEMPGASRVPALDPLLALAPRLRARYRSLLCDERSALALIQCAAFLHDVGKAETHEGASDNRAPANNHEQAGAEIARELGRQWRLSNAETRLLYAAVLAHTRPTRLATLPELTRREIYRYFRDIGEHGVDAALISLADHLATYGPDQGWERLARTVTQLLTAFYERREAVIEPRLLLSGDDLMQLLGLPPGPWIGALLARLREAQAADEVGSREQAADLVQQWAAEEKA